MTTREPHDHHEPVAASEPRAGDKLGPLTLPRPLAIVKGAIARTTGNGGLDRAAGMAYYAIQALFPAILAVVLISLLLASTEAITDALADARQQGLSEQIAGGLEEILTSAVENAGGATVIATIVSLLLAVTSASGWLAAAGRAMEPDVRQRRQRNILTGKLYFGIWTLVLLTVTVVSLSALTVGGTLADDLANELGRPDGAPGIWTVVRPVLVIGGLVCVMLVLFRIAPDPVRPLPVRRQLPGATVSGIGLIVGTLGFSYYVSNLASIGATYGAFATPIVLLLWMYYSSAIILFGAEFNHELAARRGEFHQPLRLAGAAEEQTAGHPAGALPSSDER